jgi:hypothetical protein
MNQRHFRPRPIRDFIGGLLLVPVLHTLFVMGLMLISQLTRYAYSGILLILLYGIGLSQFLYLVPVLLYFQTRGQMEVVKGLLVMALVTLLLSGGCAAVFAPPRGDYWGADRPLLFLMAGLGGVALTAITYTLFKRRL